MNFFRFNKKKELEGEAGSSDDETRNGTLVDVSYEKLDAEITGADTDADAVDVASQPPSSSSCCCAIDVMCRALLIGQVLCLVYSGTGAASSLLETECGYNSPAAQNAMMYLFLSMHVIYLCGQQSGEIEEDGRRKETTTTTNDHPEAEEDAEPRHRFPFTRLRLQAPWYYYLFIALMDVEANYLTYMAYRYTSITSISLISVMNIPSCMTFSRIILKRKYDVRHFLGVLVCLVGLFWSIFSDHGGGGGDGGGEEEDDYAANNRVLGDALAMIGAVMYGLNDTLCETIVHAASIEEYLGMLGVFGVLISVAQAGFLERDTSVFFSPWSVSCETTQATGLYFLNSMCLFLYYVGSSRFLYSFDAALLEISLLTNNLYTVLFVVVTQHTLPSNTYFGAMGLVVAGQLVYQAGTKAILVLLVKEEEEKRLTLEQERLRGAEEEKRLSLEDEERRDYGSTWQWYPHNIPMYYDYNL